jgi:hypothetical protein
MNEATIRRHLENMGWDAEDIEDAIADWADAENDDARDRAEEAKRWQQS